MMLELDKIYNMDCIEGMKQLDDNSIDMVLCDLPYGITACDWDKPINLELLWNEYKRLSKKNTVIALTATQPYTTDLINSNRNWFKYELIWEKGKATGHTLCKKRPMKAHENILIFSQKQTVYNPQMSKGSGYKGRNNINIYKKRNIEWNIKHGSRQDNTGSRYPRSVLRFGNVNLEGQHPTQKPLKLFEYLIKTYSNENDIVLDNCMGSGTTAIACKRLNRHFIGFEINKEYYDISLQRVLNVPERLEKWIVS